MGGRCSASALCGLGDLQRPSTLLEFACATHKLTELRNVHVIIQHPKIQPSALHHTATAIEFVAYIIGEHVTGGSNNYTRCQGLAHLENNLWIGSLITLAVPQGDLACSCRFD